MTGTPLPVRFTILTAAVALAGVSSGFAVGSTSLPEPRQTTATPPVVTTAVSSVTLPPATTTTLPRPALICTASPSYAPLSQPTYIAGSDESLVVGIHRSLPPGAAHIVAPDVAVLRSYVRNDGFVVIPYGERGEIPTAPSITARFVLYGSGGAVSLSSQAPSRSLVLNLDAGELRGRENEVASMITTGMCG